jgi:hemolysin III
MPPTQPRWRTFKDPWSSTTHFAGFWLALLAAAPLVSRAAGDGDLARTAGIAIYSASLVGLFLASSVYHFLDLGPRGNRWLRRLDHSAIFFLIAGTAVPTLSFVFEGSGRLLALGLVFGLAGVGAMLRVIWVDCAGWLSVALYLALTSVVIVAGRGIVPELSGGALAWLLGGGLAYGLGLVIYSIHWPNPWPGRFGHHEIWHLFVLIGAGAHYAFTWTLAGRSFPPL